MANDVKELLEESIRLEHNVAALYLFFSTIFPVDKSFWWQMGMEEKNHAALLRSGMDDFLDAGIFPEGLLCHNLEELRKANEMIAGRLREYMECHPARDEAFRFALELEESAGEAHFQLVMEDTPGNMAEKLFQQLNEEDRDHARRIRLHASSQNIALPV